MGLKYSSGDSVALMRALSANLSTARSTLRSTESACDQLVGALGDGQLSGKAYDSAKGIFTEAIKPGLAEVRSKLDVTQKELDRYTQADGLVNRYGELDEAELRRQHQAVMTQRDLTEQQIEVNRSLAAASTAFPGLATSFEMMNARLEWVLSGLEEDMRELGDKLEALVTFNWQTACLFNTWLADRIEDLGGKYAVGGYLVSAFKGTWNTKRVLEFQGGNKFYRDTAGRVRWLGSGNNPRYIYDHLGSPMSPGNRPNHLYANGKRFNETTGQRIDKYLQPLRAAGAGFADSMKDIGRDFTGWFGSSKLTKLVKGAGIIGTGLTIGGNAYETFKDGFHNTVQVRDFAVDTVVDLTSAAAAVGVGAAAGSFFLPPLGTVAGAVVGLTFNVLTNVKFPFFGDKSLVDATKDSLKKGLDWLQSKFW